MTDAAPGASAAADVTQMIAGTKPIDPYIDAGATFVTKVSSTSGGLAALLAALTGAVAGILKVTQGKVDPPSAAIIDGMFVVAAIAIQFVPTGNLATISVADSDVMERVIAMRWDPLTGSVSYFAGREAGRPHWVEAADVGRSTFR